MTIATIGRPFLGADYMLRSGQAQFDNMFAGQIYFAGELGSDWASVSVMENPRLASRGFSVGLDVRSGEVT